MDYIIDMNSDAYIQNMNVKRRKKISLEKCVLVLAVSMIYLWDIFNLISYGAYLMLILLMILIMILRKNIVIYNLKQIGLILGIVLIHGIIFSIFRFNSFEKLVMQVGTIFICYIAYMIICNRFSVEYIFDMYYKFSIIMVFVSFAQEIFVLLGLNTKIPLIYIFTDTDWNLFGKLIRVSAFMREPSFLVFSMSAAVYVAFCIILNRYKNNKKIYNKFYAICIIVTYILTGSATAYIGLVIIAFMLYRKRLFRIKTVVAILALCLAMIIIYNNVELIKVRVDDTIEAILVDDLSTKNATQINLSSYTLVTHTIVTRKSLIHSGFLGFGLGSHGISFDRYASSYSTQMLGLNREDANSLGLRLLSELGILGIIIIVIFIKKFYPKNCNIEDFFKLSISDGIIVTIILRLIRQGNYTHGAFFFFICIYILNYLEFKARRIDIGGR